MSPNIKELFQDWNEGKYRRKHMSILGTGVITDFWHHPLGHTYFTSTGQNSLSLSKICSIQKNFQLTAEFCCTLGSSHIYIILESHCGKYVVQGGSCLDCFLLTVKGCACSTKDRAFNNFKPITQWKCDTLFLCECCTFSFKNWWDQFVLSSIGQPSKQSCNYFLVCFYTELICRLHFFITLSLICKVALFLYDVYIYRCFIFFFLLGNLLLPTAGSCFKCDWK